MSINPQILVVVKEAISTLTNVDPTEINVTDHFEEDLFMHIEVDLPRLFTIVQQELGVVFPKNLVAGYVKDVQADPDKATVEEFAQVISDELEF